MPESKLAGKLGFEIRDGLMYIKGELRSYALGYGTQALWNLCLELSERLATISDYGKALQKGYTEATPQSEMARYIGKEVTELAERLAEKEKKA